MKQRSQSKQGGSSSRQVGIGQMISAGPNIMEANKLRQQLIQAKTQISDLQDELREQNNLYLNAIKERDSGIEKLNNAKESLERFEALVKQQVDRALEKERKFHNKTLEEKNYLDERVRALEDEKQKNLQLHTDLKKENYDLKKNLPDGGNQSVGMSFSLKKTDELKGLLSKKDKETEKLQKQVNYLQDQIEDFMAENKILRQHAGVPANYGKDREAVRLLDREKIDDYKKLIRVLQDDNYRLEEERAKLKHMLKQQSLMQGNNSTDPRYARYQLSPDQYSRVDEFVLKLINGEANEPSDFYALKQENQKLKIQMEALSDKGFDYIKDQMEDMLKNFGKNNGISDDQFQKILLSYEELKHKLENLNLAGGNDPTNNEYHSMKGQTLTGYSYLQPPIPQSNFDGSITQGHSHKFNQQLYVTGKNGEDKGMDYKDLFDNAFLQLQLQECFEIIYKKEESLQTQKREIDTLHSRVKKYVLMQDHLYKDFIRMEKDHSKNVLQLQNTSKELEELLSNEQKKVYQLENLVKHLQSDFGSEQKSTLIELTKQNSLMEFNLTKMTRKYQNLDEQEKLLRRNYQNIELEMTEMEVSCIQRINSLKEWKRNASYQMSQLYEQLRVAYPQAEFEAILKELDIDKQEKADLLLRNTDYAEKISNLQAELRKITDSVMEQRELTEYKNDLEKEFNVVKIKLEAYDPQYKWENYIFQQIVEKLKVSQISVTQAFEQFDVNKNGYLERKEMIKALRKLGIDLNDNELDRIIDSIDLDKNGQIEYKEFQRKLQRCGLKQLTQQELIMQNIIRSLKKLNLSITDLFDFINKDREGIVSRRDFYDMLNTKNFQDVSKQDIEKFIDYFYKDEKGGIDLERFKRIFEQFEKKFEQNQSNSEQVPNKKRALVSRQTIEKKQQVFREINLALKQEKATLRTLFKSIDVDGSFQIDFNEFYYMFRQMDIKLSESECKEIFNSIDWDGSNAIDWPELQLDFNKCISKDLSTLIEEERLLHLDNEDELMKDTYDYGKQITHKSQIGGMNNMNELEYERRIAQLEDKVKQAFLELRNENALRNLHNDQLLLLQKHHEDLRKQYDNTKAEYFKQQKKVKEQDQIIKQSIRKGEAENIQRENIKLMSDVTETKSALLSYKNMHNVIAEQVKSLKLMHDRSKDENQSLIQTLRDIQSESFDKQKFGKMYYVVMLSRWQEAAVNKKYDMKLNECKELKGEILNLYQEVENKEKDFYNAENEGKKSKIIVHSLKKELQSCKNIFLNIEKADEMNRIISQLTDEREKLEAQYFKVRSDCIGALDMLDDARIKAEYNENLRKMDLKNLKKDEISDKLIALSDTLQQLRLQSLKAERHCREYEEKKNHLERLLQNKNEEVHMYEQNIAKLEQDLNVKEEKWRNAYNDHVQKFITYKLGQDTDKIKQNEMLQKIRGDKQGNSLNENSSQRQNKIGNFKLQRPPSAYQTNQDEENDRIVEKLSMLEDDNMNKEREIQQLKTQIQNYMYMISGDDAAGQNNMMEEHHLKLTSVHQQESKEMADAAYQTIKTLNEMLEQKKIQLKTKDEQIDKLRQQMMEQRELHAEKFMKLQSEVSATGKSTLANLHKFVIQERPSRDGEQSKLSEYEFEKVQAKLSEFIELTNMQQNQINELQMQSSADAKSLRVQLQNRESEVRRLEDEVRKEQEARKKLARQRGEKNKELIEQFQKKMTEYETEIMKLKDKNEIMRLKTLTDKNLIPSINDKVIVGQTDSDKKIADLHSAVIKRDQEIVKLKEKEIKLNKEKTDLLIKFTDIDKKFQEEKSKVIKYVKEKEETLKSLKMVREQLEKERYKLDIAQSEIQNMIAEKQGLGAGTKLTYTQMIERVKELENDKFILEQQRKQMIAVNPLNHAFEYIGDPLFLNKDKEIDNIELLNESIKAWLSRPGNDRLSLAAIFQSIDIRNSGELSTSDFVKAISRLGINLRKGEIHLFKETLDKNNMELLQYKCLVRELQGIFQRDFMNKSINKLASIVEKRDLSCIQFTNHLIDPNNLTQMTLEEFKLMMNNCRAPDFQFEDSEVAEIFKDITKSNRATGVKISIHQLSQKVYQSVNALLIEKLRISLQRLGLSVSKLFAKYDANKDGNLDEQDFIKILQDSQFVIGKNMQEILFKEILDPSQKQQASKSVRISSGILKFYFESFGSISQENYIPQKSKDEDLQIAMGGQPSQTFFGASPDQILQCKKASRKILAVCHNTIIETVAKLDDLDEGIINKQELAKALLNSNIKDLDGEELNQLLNMCDRGQKGYISSNKFIDKLYEFASESENDQVLRRIYNSTQQINLRIELKNFDSNQLGKLDKVELRRGLKSQQVTLKKCYQKAGVCNGYQLILLENS